MIKLLNKDFQKIVLVLKIFTKNFSFRYNSPKFLSLRWRFNWFFQLNIRNVQERYSRSLICNVWLSSMRMSLPSTTLHRSSSVRLKKLLINSNFNEHNFSHRERLFQCRFAIIHGAISRFSVEGWWSDFRNGKFTSLMTVIYFGQYFFKRINLWTLEFLFLENILYKFLKALLQC